MMRWPILIDAPQLQLLAACRVCFWQFMLYNKSFVFISLILEGGHLFLWLNSQQSIACPSLLSRGGEITQQLSVSRGTAVDSPGNCNK
jgi:hypothetical protein